MDNRPVGVFDSGLGGLTAVRELRRILPDENIIYFGDTGRMPYGGRPREQMRKIARQNIAFAESFGVKVILAACGTISSNAADILAANTTRTVGVLAPGAEMLAETGKKTLGVIATKTSIESGAFQTEISRRAPDAEVTALACPEFVPMIESGHYLPSDPVVRDAVARSLEPLKGVGALLLGCTHYGLISDAISAYLGSDVRLVSAAECAAIEMRDRLVSTGMTGGEGRTRYLTSGSAEDFSAVASVILGADDIRAEHIPPMEVEYI